MSQTVVIEDAVILRMLSNQAFVSAFPFLSPYSARLKNKKPGSGGCLPCNKRKKLSAGDYNNIRAAIVNMSNDKKAELKRMLNAGTVRMYYKNLNNMTVKVTF